MEERSDDDGGDISNAGCSLVSLALLEPLHEKFSAHTPGEVLDMAVWSFAVDQLGIEKMDKTLRTLRKRHPELFSIQPLSKGPEPSQ